MNIWKDIAIPLMVTCGVALLCAFVALWQMYRYKARYESKQAFHAEITEHVRQIAESHAEERAGLVSQIDTLSKDNLMLLDRMKGIEKERNSLREQVAVHMHANTSEIKQSRTRKKPLARTEEEKS